jgi:leader peptidase (prepilin peptidase) / N-methyltransferase
MMMEQAAILFVATLGLAVGSFLNVCIHRLPQRQSVFWPASHCPNCNRPLHWYENIPVASYLALRGRCSGCRVRIAPTYPIVELATAALFVFWYLHFGPGLLLASRLLFAAAMLVLFVVDLRHHILPNVITIPGIAVGFIFSLFVAPGPLSSLLGILIGGGVLFILGEAYLRLRGEEGLGMGDVKMLAMIGAFLGWELMLLTLVISSFLGALVGMAMIVTRKGGLRYALPYGTFLAVGALFSAVAGDRIIAWYLAFY